MRVGACGFLPDCSYFLAWRADLRGGESLERVEPLQDTLHVLLQLGQRRHDLLVQVAHRRARSGPPLTATPAAAAGVVVSAAALGGLQRTEATAVGPGA